MARPVVGRYTQEWYDQLEPLQFDELTYDYALLKMIASMGEQLQEIDDIVQDTDDGPGWSAIMDYSRAPAKFLPWLGQLSGTVVSGALTEEQQRIQVSEAAGIKRGRVSSLIAAAQAFLTGNKTVKVQERFGGAYRITVTTYKSETPVEDWPTTNLHPNPSLEVDITSWAPSTDCTFVRDVSTAVFGTACGKLTATAAGVTTPFVFFYVTSGSLAQGTPYSISAYVKGSPSTIGKTLICALNESGGVVGDAGITAGTVVLTDQWQRVTSSGYVHQSDRTGIYGFIQLHNASLGDSVYIDGVQAEMTDKVTPFVVGSRPAGQGPVGRALLSQKAAGLVMTYNVIEGQTYQELYDDYATYQTVYTAYDTYLELLQDQP